MPLRRVFLWMLFGGGLLSAQWIHYRTAGLPRTKDGQPNLSAPAPHAANKKPDLSGVWVSTLPPRRVPVSNPAEPTFMNIENFLIEGSTMEMLPPAVALYQERRRVFGADRPS
jgi:hypothetical protein